MVREYHRKFNPEGAGECRRAVPRGPAACVPDKKNLTAILTDVLAPIRERRERYANDPATVYDILADGNARARAVAAETMDAVRSAMGLKSGAAVTR